MSVASILQALAENAGQAQLRKGAIYGGLVSDVASVPAAAIADKEKQRLVAAQQARENAALTIRQNEDTRASTTFGQQQTEYAKQQKKDAIHEAALNAGFANAGGDPAKFDVKAAMDFATKNGEPALAQSIADFHRSVQKPVAPDVKLGANENLISGDPANIDPATGQRRVVASGPPANPTTAGLDQRQQFLLSKRASGVKLTAAENAEVTGYNERKASQTPRSLDEQLLEAIKKGDTATAGTITQTMKTAAAAKGDPAAIAAANRQASTIAAQIAQQSRAQGFTEAQAGRTELTNKIETPYLDAREKADTLRNVVALAKSGNKEAASVQSLLGVLGLVTSEGVKRINTTELDQVAGAGSLFDKIKAKAGKVVSGQPLPDDLQNDLVQLSNMLEQSARKKYEQGFKQVKTRYGLKDETALAPTGSPDKGTEGSVGGKPAVWDYRNDQWGWWPK